MVIINVNINISGSMGGGILSLVGIGLGLNVDFIVIVLVNDKKFGLQVQIIVKVIQINVLLIGLVLFSLVFGLLQLLFFMLIQISIFVSFNVILGDSVIGIISMLVSVQLGSYVLVVQNFVMVQKWVSDVYVLIVVVGDGLLMFSVGVNSVNIVIGVIDMVVDIVVKINVVKDNFGIIVIVVNGVGGVQLLFSLSKIGVVNGFSVSVGLGSSVGLLILVIKFNIVGVNEVIDVKLSLDGINIISVSNSVSGVIDGVIINLVVVGSIMFIVLCDNSVVMKVVQGFVDVYNSYVKMVGMLFSYDKDIGQVGILLGDIMFNLVQWQIGSVFSGKVVGNSIGLLVLLGIICLVDGLLVVDNVKLVVILDSNFLVVQDLFVGLNGYVKCLNMVLDGFMVLGGIIFMCQQSFIDSLSKFNMQQSQFDVCMSVYEKQLCDQYMQFDILVFLFNNISSYFIGVLVQFEVIYIKKS